MDTTEQYIKMCEKAEEIQQHRGEDKWEDGDWYTCTTGHGPFTAAWTDNEDEPYTMFKPQWLPRQDQLQDMMVDCEDVQVAHHRLYQLAEFWIGLDVSTYEQLWLAYVMFELHGKSWNGENWS